MGGGDEEQIKRGGGASARGRGGREKALFEFISELKKKEKEASFMCVCGEGDGRMGSEDRGRATLSII